MSTPVTRGLGSNNLVTRGLGGLAEVVTVVVPPSTYAEGARRSPTRRPEKREPVLWPAEIMVDYINFVIVDDDL